MSPRVQVVMARNITVTRILAQVGGQRVFGPNGEIFDAEIIRTLERLVCHPEPSERAALAHALEHSAAYLGWLRRTKSRVRIVGNILTAEV
jgi:hypothetical protein